MNHIVISFETFAATVGAEFHIFLALHPTEFTSSHFHCPRHCQRHKEQSPAWLDKPEIRINKSSKESIIRWHLTLFVRLRRDKRNKNKTLNILFPPFLQHFAGSHSHRGVRDRGFCVTFLTNRKKSPMDSQEFPPCLSYNQWQEISSLKAY